MRKRLKILILEDSAIDAEMVQRFLRKEQPDWQFNLAKNKETFLLALEEFRPDTILADNSLPQFDATEALKIVRQQALYIPFIMVTGTVSEEFAAGIIKSGADDFILKDRLARLPAAIEAALKQQRTEIEKQNAFRKLSESEEKFRSLLESAPDAMVIMDNSGDIQLINARTEKMFGYAAHEIIGRNVGLLMPARQRKGSSSRRSGYFEDPKLRLGEALEFSGQRKDGEHFPVEISHNPLETAGGLLLIAAIRDITDRKKAEKALKDLEQEILDQKVQEQKRITRAIIIAQEQERNRIGQELHDNICQILSTARLYIDLAREERPELRELVNYPIELIENSISEIRALSKRSVTPLKDIDLKELAQMLVSNLDNTTTIKTIFDYNVTSQAIDDGLKLNIYRIIQEQLNNIVKHAAAKNVNISIAASNDHHIHVAVRDDGKGFDPDKKRNGIGISNMINRIESFNGQVRIESSPGKGCAVQIQLPY